MAKAHMSPGYFKSQTLLRLGIVLPIISLTAGLALLIFDPLPVQTLRNNLFDQYQRWYPRQYQDVPVRIVDIDEQSLARLGQWPWPRTTLAALVERLKSAGAAAIGLDLLLAETDRTSPKSMANLWHLGGNGRKALESLPDHDRVLARSFSGSGVVTGFVLQGKTAILGSTTAVQETPHQAFRIINVGADSAQSLRSFDTTITSLKEFAATADGNGALNFLPDNDGIVRRVPLFLAMAGQPVPTLSAEALRVAQGEKNYVFKSEADSPGLTDIRIGSYRIPTTAAGEIWVHYSKAVPERYVPAWKVLAGQVPEALLAGNIVLIGSSAQGLMDLRFSPLGGIMPGVEAHAQALEQILTEHVLSRPDWAKAAEAVAIILGGLVISLFSVRSKIVLAASVTGGFLILTLAGSWYAFREHALLIDSATPALVFATTFVAGSLIHHFVSEREQRWIKDVFSRYVSPNRVDYLIQHPEAMSLGGKRQECSFVFTDLENFTGLMEGIDPGEAVSLLNAYLDRMIGIAFRHEGTLDRIVGDAVAIMFSAPVPQPDHRARALACALEMHAFSSEYAQDLSSKGVPFGITRIGIHCGEVIVGNFGGSEMFDYRALGDPVNTAARLESLNKQIGTSICVSADILSGCPNADARPIGRFVLKGKTAPIEVLEPLMKDSIARYAPKERYQEAFALMVAGASQEAALAFETLMASYPEDPLVALHNRRMREGESGDLMLMSAK